MEEVSWVNEEEASRLVGGEVGLARHNLLDGMDETLREARIGEAPLRSVVVVGDGWLAGEEEG